MSAGNDLEPLISRRDAIMVSHRTNIFDINPTLDLEIPASAVNLVRVWVCVGPIGPPASWAGRLR